MGMERKIKTLAFRHVIFEICKKKIKLRCQADSTFLDLKLKGNRLEIKILKSSLYRWNLKLRA